MNDPNRKIDVNLSSLLSLKAELLRKQTEVNKAKLTRKVEDFVPSKTSSSSSNGSVKENKEKNKESEKNNNKISYELEDSALLEKSQKVLEAKTKFYDRMASTGGKLNSDDNCLVMFNRKKQEGPVNQINDRLSDSSGDSSEDISDGEDLVEYTDCLGRTRKCPRNNLEFIKKKDNELAASIPERLDQSAPNWMIDTNRSSSGTSVQAPESVFGEGSSVMSKHDEMRNNWEKKEEENLIKTDVHYQDVFFDEARQHGVGYYAFSTDEEERARQQKELEETRKRTLSEQEQREAQRAHREKIIAERVLAAKNRQRARLGLPPLEAIKSDDTDGVANDKTETKSERKQRKREEKRKRKLEKEEKDREEERKNHIRPWDKEKNGVRKLSEYNSDESDDSEWQYKPERTPMSQEQWNEMKRAERCADFAPIPEKIARTNFTTTGTPFLVPPPPPLIVPPPPPPPSARYNPFADGLQNFATFQTSKSNFPRRNYKASDESFEEINTQSRRSGVEIPPPLELDSISNSNQRNRNRKNNDELEKSIEAGLKYLRNNSDKGTLSTKSSWTAKADY